MMKNLLENLLKDDRVAITNSVNKSYYIYKYGIILSFILILLAYLFNFNIPWFLIITVILIAFLLDCYFIIKLLWNTLFGKILYSIFAYFIYIEATVLSERIIFINTNAPPASFSTSVNFLAGMLLLPTWIILISNVLTLLLFSIYFLPLLENIVGFFGKLQICLTRIRKYVGKNIVSHLIFFIIGLTISNILSYQLYYNIIEYSNCNLIKSTIKFHSYYPFNSLICNNKSISEQDYFHLIGDNKVSVAKTDYNGNIIFSPPLKCDN